MGVETISLGLMSTSDFVPVNTSLGSSSCGLANGPDAAKLDTMVFGLNSHDVPMVLLNPGAPLGILTVSL